MKGLSGEEKAALQRIGNLVDTLSYNQRQGTAPGAGGARVQSNAVPAPQDVTADAVPDGFQLSWEPVDVAALDSYEVQYAETATFSTSDTIATVGNRVTIKKRVAGDILFVRVRTVTKDGYCSKWTTTSTVSMGENFFVSDQDTINPENRSTVLPKPILLGGPLDNSDYNDNIFVGIGAFIGPSPVQLDDTGQTDFNTNVNVRHDITYVMNEATDPFPGMEVQRVETIALRFLEQENDTFYIYDPSFYIYPHVLPGSFTDFFDVESVTADPSITDVEMLRYQDSLEFYIVDYRQAGIVYNAVMSNLKF